MRDKPLKTLGKVKIMKTYNMNKEYYEACKAYLEDNDNIFEDAYDVLDELLTSAPTLEEFAEAYENSDKTIDAVMEAVRWYEDECYYSIYPEDR